MPDIFGRLIATGPLAMRGPVNVSPPLVLLAFPGAAVLYSLGIWQGSGAVLLEGRVFHAGDPLPEQNGEVIIDQALIGLEVYVVVTAIDDTGALTQAVSAPVAVSEIHLFQESTFVPAVYAPGVYV